MNGKPGDLLLFAADKNKIVWNVLGALRLMLGAELGPVSYTHLDVYKRQVYTRWTGSDGQRFACHTP